MQINITSKLVIAIVGVTAVVLAATLALAWWSFQFGFLNYINAQEARRLANAIPHLAAWYENNAASWEGLEDHTLRRLIDRRAPGRGARRPPPPRGRPFVGSRGGRDHPPPHLEGPSPPKSLMFNDWLVDEDGSLIAGSPSASKPDQWIDVAVVTNDQTIGYLRTATRTNLRSPLEAQFATQQLRASAVITGLALLLALLIGIGLARTLLAPIRRTITSVDALAAGRYDTRLDTSRGDELGALMRNIDRLAASLESNQSARQRWFADVSHELRTPIAILKAELEAVRDGVRTLDSSQLSSFAAEVTRLEQLIEDLYDLSLSDLGGLRYEFARCNVSGLLDEVAQDFGSRHPQLTIDTKIQPDVWAHGDSKRLEQLFANLFENACAYTDTPGEVRCTLNATQDGTHITLEDSPPGVPADSLNQLFEPLFRMDTARSRRDGGAGLGLAICRNIVQAHGGHIAASKSVLGGLRVDITLESV